MNKNARQASLVCFLRSAARVDYKAQLYATLRTIAWQSEGVGEFGARRNSHTTHGAAIAQPRGWAVCGRRILY